MPLSDSSVAVPVAKNPFARKPGSENPRNPFASGKSDPNRTIQKSESFFNKIEAAADGDAGKKAKRVYFLAITSNLTNDFRRAD